MIDHYCLTLREETAPLESLPDDPGCQYPDGWEHDVLVRERLWTSPDGHTWTEQPTTYAHDGPNWGDPEDVSADEAAAVTAIYRGDYYSSTVRYWAVDNGGVQRDAPTAALTNLPSDVLDALEAIDCPTDGESDLLSALRAAK